MPGKNTRKNYVSNSYYHIYNRGVEKRVIFCDTQDSGVFLSYLKTYLLPKNEKSIQQKIAALSTTWREKDRLIKELRLNNFYQEITLHCYCLMPNHFHLLLSQKSRGAIDEFMNSINTRYVMYFNRKYQRVGPLYQGVYKAVLVDNDEQLLHLSAYIHRNPIGAKRQTLHVHQGEALRILNSHPSSLPEYLKLRTTKWLDTENILTFFSKTNKNLSYEKFVLGSITKNSSITELAID